MGNVTKTIGLSLGADICWPICFEEILREMKLSIPFGGDNVNFQVERVMIEPYDLQQPCKYSVVLDRLTHWYHTSREWIKKSVLLNDLYVLNNPWAVQSMEKQTTYCAMMRLGLPIPRTWMVPPKSYERTKDLEYTLRNYAKLFDLGSIGRDLDYPLFMKPYDGGGWVGVSKIDNEGELRTSYEQSGKNVMHLQAAVSPYEHFMRCVGLGPQVKLINYDPSAPLHGRYVTGHPQLSTADQDWLRKCTLIINAFFLWDFNSCEALSKDGVWHPIDYANPCPDSQVTSLHWHFPWYIKANIRWAIFCATTGRKMRLNQNWQPYFDIADSDMPQDEKFEAYAQLAEQHFETERFEEFCDRHLGHLDEVTWNFFNTDRAKQAIREKVASLYPHHEIETFTEHFWNQIQQWRQEEQPA